MTRRRSRALWWQLPRRRRFRDEGAFSGASPAGVLVASPAIAGRASRTMPTPAPSGGSAGVAAPGAGSTAMSAARWRMCSRKEVINSAEGGAAPVGAGVVPSSSGASSGGWSTPPHRRGVYACKGGRRRGAWGCHGVGWGVLPLLVCHVGGRRVRVTVDVRVE